MQEKVILICSECSSRNYTVKKNKEKKERVEMLKYCRYCNKRTIHKETK